MAVPSDPAYAAAYCDRKRFPLTTQKGLSLKSQQLIDAINYDDIKRIVEEDRPLDENLQGRLKEYEEKAKLHQGAATGPSSAANPRE